MKQLTTTLTIESEGPGLYPFDDRVSGWLKEIRPKEGLLNLYIAHTSASLTIQENYDPDVRRDLADFFNRLVKRDPSLYRHNAEGPDDMPAHIRSALTDTSLTIPVRKGRLGLGTWQGIFLFEHRDRGSSRKVHLTYQGS